MNYFEALKYGTLILQSNNIKTFNLDSELILSEALNLTREKILINQKKKIKKEDFNVYKNLLDRRKNNEPIAYITKKKEFWRYSFIVSKDVLIPRPETEQIVEEVLKYIGLSASKHVLDIGTGSGCIIISILKERPKFHCTAIDISKKAIKVAISNAKMHHLRNKIKFVNIDIDKLYVKKYDLIVSNPPYICSNKIKRLEKNVRMYEPLIALEAGLDGLREIKKLIRKSTKLLKRNGKLIIEIGHDQEIKVKMLLKKNNFYINKVCKDLQSYPRIIVSTKLS